MERQSDKHNPRLDEEIKKETDSLTRGAPVESRAQESREKEGPADGQPTPDALITSAEDVPPRSLSHAELELRHDLARFLEGSIFPASREKILDSAQRMHAPVDVLKVLKRLPDRSYEGFPEVWTALGGHIEGERRHAG